MNNEENKKPIFEKLKIGIDFGGVCSMHSERYESVQSQSNNQDEFINIPNCETSLRKLKELGHELYLVSFCGKARALSTKKYLDTLNIFDHLVFVKKPIHKAAICKYYGLDILIDDRSDLLENIAPTQSIHFTFENNRHNTKFIPTLIANNWIEVMQNINKIKSLSLDSYVGNIDGLIYHI